MKHIFRTPMSVAVLAKLATAASFAGYSRLMHHNEETAHAILAGA